MLLRCVIICAFICLCFLNLASCQRKIVEGEIDKPYMVYLVEIGKFKKYDAWLCGGAIVTPLYIVTSAACVVDVVHMYAIAGYNIYVPADKLNDDLCTKEKKKKIINVYLPKAYTFSYREVKTWANLDIAVAKVESAYDFSDYGSYMSAHCSYVPNKIDISYDETHQNPGVPARVLGWGHLRNWRDPADKKDYNSRRLRFASVTVQDKETCKKQYTHLALHAIIDKYMTCAVGTETKGAKRSVIEKNKNMKDGCVDAHGIRKDRCGDEYDHFLAVRRNNAANGPKRAGEFLARRSGICQNDHGGPLVTWRKAEEVLIGVVSVFRVNRTTSECIGPYLFTSTSSTRAFLRCILPADNENTKMRPQNTVVRTQNK